MGMRRLSFAPRGGDHRGIPQGERDVHHVRELLPEAALLGIDVHPLPNLYAVNIVIHGLLGRGVAENARSDPQAKGLGEHLRARLVDIPAHLLPEPGTDLS